MGEKGLLYGNRITFYDGIRFDSAKESNHYRYLKMLERVGKISNLEVHPRFRLLKSFKKRGMLVRGVVYEADFSYLDKKGQKHVIDVKFVRADGKVCLTVESSLKIKWFESKFKALNVEFV